MIIGHRQHHRVNRNNGFTATDVALQQSVHRKLASHVTPNIDKRFFLVICQFKRKTFDDSRVNDRRCFQRRRLQVAGQFASTQRQRKLHDQKFLENKSCSRRKESLLVVGMMDLSQRLVDLRQRASDLDPRKPKCIGRATAKTFRHDFGQRLCHLIQNFGGQLSQFVLLDSFGQRIDRQYLRFF